MLWGPHKACGVRTYRKTCPKAFFVQVDPMFQRMAASFDENSTAGVFLSVLFSEDSRCELRFPSHMTLLKTQPPPVQVPHQNVPASPFTGKLALHITLCSKLQDSLLLGSLSNIQYS